MVAAASGRVAVELTVGLPGHQPLIDGGRDLDNYLFPVAQQLGPERVAAMFGRKPTGRRGLQWVRPSRKRLRHRRCFQPG